MAAFNNIGHYWIKNGSAFWAGIKAGGTDWGAQVLMAIPKPFDTFPTPDGITQLETGRQQVRFLYANGGTEWIYFCLVENTYFPGWNATFFSLSGGGLS
jgi:hypothetical protein